MVMYEAIREAIDAAEDAPKKRETVDAEVAFKRIGCSRSAGYAAMRRGQIPNIKVGRRRFIPAAALERLLRGDAA